MNKILSIVFTFFLFLNFSGVVLAQKASPSAVLKTPEATIKVEVKTSASPTIAPVSFNKILASMPKASFLIFLVVLLFLAVELAILKKKKSEEENIPRVTAETFKEEVPGRKKTKNILTILILIFILMAIPLTLILVKQRQEVRKKAAEPVCTEGRGNCDGAAAEGAATGRTAQQVCYSWAGSGCDWRGDPYSGSCYCRGVGATAAPGQGEAANITCKVEGSSIKFTNNSTTASGNRTVSGQWCQSSRDTADQCRASDSRVECQNSGQVTASSGNLGPGESKNVTVGGISCGIWQIDFTDCEGRSAHGCNWNDSCAPLTTTPAPTRAPTAPPTAAPTRVPTAPPTAAPTVPPTNALTPTPPPPSILSCNQGPCNVANTGCGSGLTCIHDTWFGHDQWVCRNNDCQIESDCICKQAQNIPGPTSPPRVGGPGPTTRPYVPVAGGPAPTPTIPVPVIPQAGIDTPTIMTVAAGALLLIVGFALAL